jgi:MFS family permease
LAARQSVDGIYRRRNGRSHPDRGVAAWRALDAYGWRIAFLLGAAILPLGLWLRRSLPETLHAPETDTAVPVIEQTRLRTARSCLRVILLGLVVLASHTIGAYIFLYILTYAPNTLHMSAATGFVAETAGNLLGTGARAARANAIADRGCRLSLKRAAGGRESRSARNQCEARITAVSTESWQLQPAGGKWNAISEA